MNTSSRSGQVWPAVAPSRSSMPMTVLQLIGTFDASGAETVVLNLANALHDRRRAVHICTRTGGPLIPYLRGVTLHTIPKNALFDWRYLGRLCELVQTLDVDVIHSHLFGNDLYGALVAARTGCAHICTIHGADSLRSAKRRLAYHVIARMADRIVTVSEALNSRFLSLRCTSDEKVLLIRNGIDFTRVLHSTRNVDSLRRDLGINAGQCVIGAIGNVKRVKGYEVLIQAFAKIHEASHDVVLLIAGAFEDPGYRDHLEGLISQLNLGQAVRLLGPRSDVGDLLRLFDIYALPSHSEGTSLALLEAMAAEKPIVATAVGGTPYVIKDGESGLLVPPGDHQALASTVCKLLGDRTLAARLGRSAARIAAETYDLQQMVDRYVNLYDEVIDARRLAGRHSRSLLRSSS
jgi:L-malate glycosyltransferase